MVKIIERLNTAEWVPPWIYYQHIARYQWAAPFTKGKKVADAACGTGYGVRMLLDAGAESVDGFDVSLEAVEEANKTVQAPNVRFTAADARNLPVGSDQFDYYTSFETIEHIQDDASFLAEVRRVLKPDGTFICSTPNRLMTNPGITINEKPFNPFHIREYTRAELADLLAYYFSSVDFYGQSNYGMLYSKMLNAVGKRIPMLAVRTHQIRKTLGIPFCKLTHHLPVPWNDAKQPEVMIAVCSKKK